MQKIQALAPEKLATTIFNFKDKRLPALLFRYRARNYPETLTNEEQAQWLAFCRKRLTDEEVGAALTFDRYFARLQELHGNQKSDLAVLDALDTYGRVKMQKLGLAG